MRMLLGHRVKTNSCCCTDPKMDMFKRVLMCPPTYFRIAYKINPWMGGVVDSKMAMQQWTELKNAVEKCGIEVDLIDPVEEQPDMVFTCNSGLALNNKATLIQVYLAHFRHGERQGEREHFKKWYIDHGFELCGDEDVFFEGGGDAVFSDKTVLWAGHGFRSDKNIYSKMHALGDFKIIDCELTSHHFYHLDTCFSPVTPKLAVWHPDAFTRQSRELIQNNIETITVSSKDAERFACNCIAIGTTVIMPSGCDETAEKLQKRGLKTIMVNMSEFMKSGGAVQCLIMKL
ncbi:unnamed protein product [Soboliphyme baturini]|uniref:Amidinotransferase n=1 Tax=Soboliphyme baturini TaxID=241478 RepID=A0A183J0M8_9BILA|nr:unnamed protein product [Soboliphyme baturini]